MYDLFVVIDECCFSDRLTALFFVRPQILSTFLEQFSDTFSDKPSDRSSDIFRQIFRHFPTTSLWNVGTQPRPFG